MPPTSDHVDIIARERIDNIKENIEYLECKMDEFSKGAMEKMAGDVQMASKVNQISDLVNQLDKVLVRGNGNSRSVKSVVESLQKDNDDLKISVDHLRSDVSSLLSEIRDIKRDVVGTEKLKKDFDLLSRDLKELKREEASVAVAKINSKSTNWKVTATLIASLIASLAAILVSILR